MHEFLCYSIKFRSKYDFELNAIANMDETPLDLNMPSHNRTEGWIDESKYRNTKTRKSKSNSFLNCSWFWRKFATFINSQSKGRQRYRKEITKANKYGEQESARILTGKCMVKWEHDVEMDIWGLQKIYIFGLKWRTLLVLDNANTHKEVK